MFADSNVSVSNYNAQNPAISSSSNTNPNLSLPQAYPASQHPVNLQQPAYPAPQHSVQPQQPAYPAAQHPVQPQQPSPYSNGLSSSTMTAYDQSSNPASSWNGQFAQGMVPPQQAPNYGMDTMLYCDINL
jgi:hypothetical protein